MSKTPKGASPNATIRAVIPVTLVLLLGAVAPLLAEPGADEQLTLITDELQQLDRQLQGQLKARQQPTENGAQLDDQRRRLDNAYAERLKQLRRRVRGMADCETVRQSVLWDKIDQLGLLLSNLERATAANRPPAAPAALSTSGASAVRTSSALAPPGNDLCADAMIVGFGTWMGSTINAGNEGEGRCGASHESPDVWFRFVAESTGPVGADTFGSGYDTVLSVYSACGGVFLTCNDDAYGLQSAVLFSAEEGQDYLVRVSGFNGASGLYMLHIGEASAFSGEVLDAATSEPVLGARVYTYDQSGDYVVSSQVDELGRYECPRPAGGPYFAVAGRHQSHLYQLYDHIPCPGGPDTGCDPASGTAIILAPGTVTQDVDFALTSTGTITGTITGSDVGPLGNAYIEVYCSSDWRAGSGYSETDGSYRVDGLPDGTCYVVAEHPGYRDELYQDHSCLGGVPTGCQYSTGTPVTIPEPGATVSGIDLELARKAVITGTVSEVTSGVPIGGVTVEIWDHNGSLRKTVATASDGSYLAGGLDAGTYFAVAEGSGHARLLYQGITCELGCIVTLGTPIVVAEDGTVSGIDLELERRAEITGMLSMTGSGQPIPDYWVTLYNEWGSAIDNTFSNDDGMYSFTGLDSGLYYLATSGWEYANEIYLDIPCGPDCDDPYATPMIDISLATPVIASAGTVSVADITLDRLGIITGTVSESGTGVPITDIYIRATPVPVSGQSMGSGALSFLASPGSLGEYSIDGLPAGSYSVYTANIYSGYPDRVPHPYVNEMYDDVPCFPSGQDGCDQSAATPVTVSLNGTTAGIDLELDRGGTISGRVINQKTGLIVPWTKVTLWDDSGAKVADTLTLDEGAWQFTGLIAGSYFVTAYRWSFIDTLYEGISCPGGPGVGCIPTDGTPIPVVLGTTIVDLDIVLEPYGGAISGVVSSALSGFPLQGVEVRIFDGSGTQVAASQSLQDGQYTVTALDAGTYYAVAVHYTLTSEVFDNIPCNGCDPTLGIPIVVETGETVRNVDFALLPAGAISGSVTDALTGNSLGDVWVEVWDAAGSMVGSADSDLSGSYQVSWLQPGTYTVTTTIAPSGYGEELYDDLPCDDGPPQGCDPTTGTPVAVTAASTTSGINFALDYLSSAVLATVTGDGVPLAGVRLHVWDAAGALVTTGVTGDGGSCLVPVSTGTYYLSTYNTHGFTDEVFRDRSCPVAAAIQGGCNPLIGEPVTLSLPEVTTGIDFDLALAELIFRDDFESGDTSAWGSVQEGGK